MVSCSSRPRRPKEQRLKKVLVAAWLGGCVWLVGCASSSHGASARTQRAPTQHSASSLTPAPASSPPAAPLATDEANIDPEPGERWVRQRVQLQATSTSIELFAHPGALVQLLSIADGVATVRIASFWTSEEYDEDDPLIAPHGTFDTYAKLEVTLPARLLSKEPVPLQVAPPREDARDQQRVLYDSATTTSRGLALVCGPVEIMADLPGNVQKLRQIREGIEVRGFTRIPLKWSWDTNSCRPRLIAADVGADVSPAPPADFVASDPRTRAAAKRYLERGRPLYEVELSDNGLSCTRVRYTNHDLIFDVATGKGLERVVTTYGGFISKDGAVELMGPSVTSFDERGRTTRSVAFMCLAFMQLLRETPDTVEFANRSVSLRGAAGGIAYHPDEVSRWYKTETGCQQAIAEHPRLRLLPGQRAIAVATPLHSFSGC